MTGVVTIEQVLADIEEILGSFPGDSTDDHDDGLVGNVIGQLNGYVRGLRRATADQAKKPAAKKPARGKQ